MKAFFVMGMKVVRSVVHIQFICLSVYLEISFCGTVGNGTYRCSEEVVIVKILLDFVISRYHIRNLSLFVLNKEVY